MNANGKPAEPPSVPAGKGYARKIALIVGLLMVIPAVTAAFVFPLLSAVPFESVDELKPDDIGWFNVRLFNRGDLDGGGDVGPYDAAPSDYATLLAPLGNLTEVADFPDARGPWLGEYRIVTKSGRRGGIRFYWHRDPAQPRDTPPTLRVQIASKKYVGGSVAPLVAAATAAEANGKK